MASNRPELIAVRDVIVRHFHKRSPLDEVQQVVLGAARSMRNDGMTMEEILTILRNAVTLAAGHVANASIAERAVSLRSQMTPWLISLYLNESGEFDEPPEE